MGSILNYIVDIFRGQSMNNSEVTKDLITLIQDKDISQAMEMFQNRDLEVLEAIQEYDPNLHDVMSRPNKLRKGREPYKTEKLPRRWQAYINEVALFYLLGQPIRWSKNDPDVKDEAFDAFTQFLKDTRFNTTMRQAKRIAGAETECAKLYHIYRNEETNKPEVKVVLLAKSLGYTLRPMFDQYGTLLAFGYGYYLKEGLNTVEHFDIQTSQFIYRCKKHNKGWEVTTIVNPTGKINTIYYQQEKEWEGAQSRINRDEQVDSKSADTNNYFADPKAKVSADVLESLSDPNDVGEVIRCFGSDSVFEYVTPPDSVELKRFEKDILKESILNDTFTFNFSPENTKGLGTLTGEALKRAMAPSYMKRDNRKEIYEIAVDREKNLILAIMKNVTHIELKAKLEALQIDFEFSEPFQEDIDKKWTAIGKLYNDGIVSLETAIKMLGVTDKPTEEIKKILEEKQQNQNNNESNKEDNQSSQNNTSAGQGNQRANRGEHNA